LIYYAQQQMLIQALILQHVKDLVRGLASTGAANHVGCHVYRQQTLNRNDMPGTSNATRFDARCLVSALSFSLRGSEGGRF
jgi:hypothetical protein